MGASKYSSLITPAALGLFSTPDGCHERSEASVVPYAPLKVSTPKRLLRIESTSIGSGAAPIRRREVFASGAPERGIAGLSTSWASRYAMVPSVDVIVAPVRFISGQNRETEKRCSMAARPP